METIGILLTIYMYWRCVRVTHLLLGPLGNINIQMLHQRFFANKNSSVTCMVDGSLRGVAIAVSPVFGVPELTVVLIIHTCITAAGITTAMQRHLRGAL